MKNPCLQTFRPPFEDVTRKITRKMLYFVFFRKKSTKKVASMEIKIIFAAVKIV